MSADASRKGVRRQLRRIVALLLALGLLAERAAGRHGPVRLLVAWVLRHGEAVAADHVLAVTGRLPAAPCRLECSDAGCLDLAARFRALAAALSAFVEAAAMAGVPVAARTAHAARHALAALAAFARALRFVERLDSS